MNPCKNVACFVLLSAIVLTGCKDENKTTNLETEQSNKPQTEMTAAEKIAEHYGVSKFNDVEELQFTFNVESNGNIRSRHFKWNPKTDDVVFTSPTDTVTYNRNSIDSTAMNADKAFINDSYWLLAPFKLVWDEGAEISDPVKAIAPISENEMNKLTITYTGEGGYTPGDAYDFYYTDNYEIKEWAFRRGNQTEPSLITTLEDKENFNGLTLLKDRKRPGEDWRLFFTDLSVKFSK